jgi:hypothetical protein
MVTAWLALRWTPSLRHSMHWDQVLAEALRPVRRRPYRLQRAGVGCVAKRGWAPQLQTLHNPKLFVPFLTDKVLQHCPKARDGFPAGRCIRTGDVGVQVIEPLPPIVFS